MSSKQPDLSRSLFRTEAMISRKDLLEALQPAGDGAVVENHQTHYHYYDTFDWRLYFRGLVLVAGELAGVDSLQMFRNTEPDPVATTAGEVGSGLVEDLPAGKLQSLAQKRSGIRRLLPRLDIEAKAHLIRIINSDQKTVLRLTLETFYAQGPDRQDSNNAGQNYAGQRLQLHPLKGYENYAEKAANSLRPLFPESPGHLDIFVHCLQAVGQQAGDYSSSIKIYLEPDMPAGQAARQLHLKLLDMMKRNRPGLLDEIDTEFLHDFRVAIRRTRSALSLVDKNVLPGEIVGKAKADFRLIGQQTNRARDLDVYLLALPGYKCLIPEEYRESLDPFGDYLRQQRRLEQRRLETFLSGQQYNDIISSWQEYLEGTLASTADGKEALVPIRSIANRRIWKTYSRLMKEGGAINRESSKERYHELRIDAKKLRYLMEFMASLYPGSEMDAAISALKKLQNVLGEFQDAVVQSEAIRHYGCEMSKSGIGGAETLMAMGMVAETVVEREQVALKAFRKTFDRFADKTTRTTFRGLFKNRA